MNIDDLTYGQIKQIVSMFGGGADAAAPNPHIGKYVIVRCYASGVHAGRLVSQHGRQVELASARRLWRWVARTGISTTDIAVHGINADGSKICSVVSDLTILDALEIIPCTAGARESIEGAPVYNGGKNV